MDYPTKKPFRTLDTGRLLEKYCAIRYQHKKEKPGYRGARELQLTTETVAEAGCMIMRQKKLNKKAAFYAALKITSAREEIRTPTPFGATPSR
jgi:hypothetical protein